MKTATTVEAAAAAAVVTEKIETKQCKYVLHVGGRAAEKIQAESVSSVTIESDTLSNGNGNGGGGSDISS